MTGFLSITVLGCSGTYAGPGGASSGYLVRTPTTAIWVDCGPGTLGNLQTHIALEELDGIVCSHAHPDHWLELPVVANAFRYGLDLPQRRLPLHWTAETAARFEAAYGRPPEPTFAPTVIADGAEASIGDIAIRFGRTDHPVETLAMCFRAHGRSIVYSADTADGWRLARFAPGVDLAVIEATFDESQTDVAHHLTASQAALQAAEADVASLVLTHLAPGSDPAARLEVAEAHFDGPVAVAEIGRTYRAGDPTPPSTT